MLDSVDEHLGLRLTTEANTILANVTNEIQYLQTASSFLTESDLSRLSVMDVFLTKSVLEKLRRIVNCIVHERYDGCVSITDLNGVIILHVLAASHGASVECITEPKNRNFSLKWESTGRSMLGSGRHYRVQQRARSKFMYLDTVWQTNPHTEILC